MIFRCHWDDENDPNGNVQNIAQHGVTIEDVEAAVKAANNYTVSRNSDNFVLFGEVDGEELVVVFFVIVDDLIYPKTAYFI